MLSLTAILAAAGTLAWALYLRRRLREAGALPVADSESDAPAARSPASAEGPATPSRTDLSRVVDSLSDAFFRVDAEWRLTFFNREARKLFERLDRAPDDLPGAFFLDVFPTPSDDPARQALDGAMKTREPRARVAWNERLDAWLEVRAHPVADGGLSVYVRDVTERKEAEEALRESEERYRTLFEDDVAGNFVTDPDGKLEACNEAFARMFGFQSVAEAVGSDVYDLYPSREDREEFLDRIREERTLEYLETEARRTDGTPLHLVENVRGVFDEDGHLTELRGHLIDVTEKKDLETQLRQAQKLEAIGRLAGGIAHDFNNLLTTISGHSDLLLTEEDLPGRVRDDVRKIRRAARRAARLTGQLLAFSRRQDLRPEVLTLNRVVEEVNEMLGRLMGERIEVRIETRNDLPPVRADAGRLEQVVMNLAVNARDAMPEGGELVISTGVRRVEEGGSGSGTGSEVPAGSYAFIEVRDTGTGIPEEALEKIFEPFYTTKGPGEGTGLGLAMVYGIVTQSGGYVQVETEEGIRTAVRILFPPVAEEEATRHEASGDETPAEGTVLVHQRDPVVRKLVRRVLRREGHTVLEAESPDEAAAFLQEWSGSLDLVLTDTLGGDGEGPALDRIARETRPQARFLLTVPERRARRAVPDGHAVLRTPFSPRDLARRVHRFLAEGSSGGAPDG